MFGLSPRNVQFLGEDPEKLMSLEIKELREPAKEFTPEEIETGKNACLKNEPVENRHLMRVLTERNRN